MTPFHNTCLPCDCQDSTYKELYQDHVTCTVKLDYEIAEIIGAAANLWLFYKSVALECSQYLINIGTILY